MITNKLVLSRGFAPRTSAFAERRAETNCISKMSIVLEEADESAFWIELLVDAAKVEPQVAEPLLAEANELVAIAAASINIAKRKSD